MKPPARFSRRSFLKAAGIGGAVTLAAVNRLLRYPALPADPLGVNGVWLRQSSRSSWAPADSLTVRRWLISRLKGRSSEKIAFFAGPATGEIRKRLLALSQAASEGLLVQFDFSAELEGQSSLQLATQRLFGVAAVPLFDLTAAETCFFVGCHFAESWLSQATPPPGAQWVVFGPYCPTDLTGRVQWIPLAVNHLLPLLLALAPRVAALRGLAWQPGPDEAGLRHGVGLPEQTLHSLAQRLAESRRPLVIPGALGLGAGDGGAVALSALGLNALLGNLGQPGGVFLPAERLFSIAPVADSQTLAEAAALVERIHRGLVRTLVVYDLDLLTALPADLQVRRALEKLETLIVLGDARMRTAQRADLVLPLAGLAELERVCGSTPAFRIPPMADLPRCLPPVLVVDLAEVFASAQRNQPIAAESRPHLLVLPRLSGLSGNVYLQAGWARRQRIRPGQRVWLRSADEPVPALACYTNELVPGTLGVSPAWAARLLRNQHNTAGGLLSVQPVELCS